MLNKIGLSPGKKQWVFLLSAALITVPVGTAINSVAVILFVLYALLSVKKEDVSFKFTLLLPVALFVLMVLSLSWSINVQGSLKALGKEASLLFIPIAFCLNGHLRKQSIPVVLRNYSVAMCLFGLFYLGRAIFRYSSSGDIGVFFYHELSTLSVNAIYLSAMFSAALFYFVALGRKTLWSVIAALFMMGLIVLLSSKTIIIIDVLLIVVWFLFYSSYSRKLRIVAAVLFLGAVITAGYFSKIKERIAAEYSPNAGTAQTDARGMHHVTIREAWEKEKFSVNDYFNGTAFRVYQIRIFTEMLQDEPILFTGYGVNVSLKKVEEKGIEHSVFNGDADHYAYNKQNFHNQYIEAFADLGIIGFLLVLAMVLMNLKNSFATKDFVHIAFAILMIALLLTESFLWRQRGVVFFTIFYCLFNGVAMQGIDKEKHEKNIDNRGRRISGFPSV